MKPIIRFTLGATSQEGIDCLRISIKNLIKLYKEEFDIYVCYNNVDIKKIKWFKNFPLRLINQIEYKNSLGIEPINHPCWKLYPPRLNINTYEIFIDNDLVLYKKLDLNSFIKNSNFFISEAIQKSYGTMQDKITKKPYLNSGIFGIPAGFDFKNKINSTIEKFNIKWENSHFEEQAVVSHILNENDCEVIDLKKIYVCYQDIKNAEFGLHFVGLNNGSITKHWNEFSKKNKTKLL